MEFVVNIARRCGGNEVHPISITARASNGNK